MDNNYPRVTHILQETKPEGEKQRLLAWQRKNLVKSSQAMQNGTNFHSAIERYFKLGIVPTFGSETENNRWNTALPQLNIFKEDFLCLEAEVWSDKYKYAGRLDCLAWENSNLILIDWKTSAWFKKKEWIKDYFLQGAAYSLAAYECGIAPVMPHEICICIFTPKKAQFFKKNSGL
jgi:ATP-dependent exoDNAse (exonuclease V) beta subunit